MNDELELYIIRHGQSTNNALPDDSQATRVNDAPLTDLGKRQAEALATYLARGQPPVDEPEYRLLATARLAGHRLRTCMQPHVPRHANHLPGGGCARHAAGNLGGRARKRRRVP
ncbi:MAG: histidine phosphatase family protein [Chloroflexi bacterium]|uniref:phosphoglycerate mutase family protein n=1 Tax=Candidatus Flexifilum breve TaxID=3140694 RepID=UPI0031368D3A|nr:histidine phosphatase family protein [Chloroflexota bacterium]